ncbi:3-oxoacyl-ACP synthase [Actinomadura spongiicola]|uniref:3-oxoacyl-ACP synthase n=1 Tax=Actinomadura spongiicola TaxID=2303421 RepID=A0A372GMW1_9ACTN|nr:3-oxoacyl-ACP synthase III family protein [Actinomadura spongiicola]RFS86726.1 3-oxoacyl-ACP synthase [Actinomadura spongiicola]
MDRPDIHLLAVGTSLPGPAVDNATLAARFGLPRAWEQWIDTFVGTRSRHYAIDLETGERRYTLADLAEAAGRRALAAAELDPAEVDVVVMSTSSPDMLMPATVNVVADRLGVDGVPTFQLQSGCAGAVQALEVAAQMLRCGPHRRALVLGGDTSAKHFDVGMRAPDVPMEAQVNGLLFGDGAGAAVLGTGPAYGSPVLRGVFTRLVGRDRSPGQTVEWFSWGDRTMDRPPVTEDFKAVEESAPRMAAEALDEVLDGVGWKKSDLDYLLPPQLSARMTERVLEELDAPGAEPVSRVLEIGNTGNAIPYFQLEQVLPRLADGDRLAGVSVEASKWIKAGYALEMAAH